MVCSSYISILNEYFEYLLERICLHSLFLFDGQVGGMFVAEDEVQEHPRYIKMTVSLVVFPALACSLTNTPNPCLEL